MAAQIQRLPKVNSGRFFTHFLNLMYGDGVAAFTFMIHVYILTSSIIHALNFPIAFYNLQKVLSEPIY